MTDVDPAVEPPRESNSERLALEREKLELERLRLEREGRFMTRHLGAVLTGIVSIAAVVVSASQVWVARTDRLRELEAASRQRERESAAATAEQDRRWNLDVANFVVQHQDKIFADDPQQQARMRDIMSVTFPPEIASILFARLADSAPESAPLWREATKSAAAASGARIINVAATDSVRIIVEVGSEAIPYSVSLDGRTIIRSLINREEVLSSLREGVHRLRWTFAHVSANWRHAVRIQVGQGPLIVLDDRSERAGDTPTSDDFALLAVGPS